MDTKQFTSIIKPLSASLAWLGGSLAAITALLSALGFLVLRAHLELLGVTMFVPNPPDTWASEGARFLYNSVLYFFGSCLSNGWVLLLALLTLCLLGLLSQTKWLTKAQAMTRSPLVQGVILSLSVLGMLLVIELFLDAEAPTHLLVQPQIYDTAIAMRSTATGMLTLRMQYARLLAILPLVYVWLRLLSYFLHFPPAQAEAESSTTDSANAKSGAWRAIGLWMLRGMFVLLLLLLPMLYGKMISSNEYVKIRLVRKFEDITPSPQPVTPGNAPNAARPYEGWLLYQGNGRIVLYKGAAAAEPIQIYKDDFAQMQILGYENILGVQ